MPNKSYNMLFNREVTEKKTQKLSQTIVKDFVIEMESEMDSGEENKSVMKAEIRLGELSKGMCYFENTKSQKHRGQKVYTKVNVDQSFGNYKYFQSDLGLIWVSETQKCVPISVNFYPQMTLINNTQDYVYIML